MKRSDLIQQLTQLGATFAERSKHIKVYLNGRQTTIPRHREIKPMTAKAILRQLQIE